MSFEDYCYDKGLDIHHLSNKSKAELEAKYLSGDEITEQDIRDIEILESGQMTFNKELGI